MRSIRSICLAELIHRFNRRFDPASLVSRFGLAATLNPPMPYRIVKLAETDW